MSYDGKLLNLISSEQVRSICCPIQSGSNRILKLMNRYHASEDIADYFLKIRNINPEIQLITHLVVGFPSETEEDFNQTLYWLSKIHFDSVIIFPYHEKECTQASKLGPKIQDYIIQERVNRVLRYLKKRKIKVRFSCLGS